MMSFNGFDAGETMMGRTVKSWVLAIASLGAVFLVLTLPRVFPDSQVLRWAEGIFVVLIFPVIVLVGARALKGKR